MKKIAPFVFLAQPKTDFKNSWNEASHTCLLQFENSSDGVSVEMGW